MLKQQLSPRSVHPYQTTVVPRSEKQFATANQQRAKFPWVEQNNTPVYQFTGNDSSSTSENPYHMPQYYQTYQRDYGPPSPVYQMPYATGSWRNQKKNDLTAKPLPSNTYSFPPCASSFSLPLCEVERSHTVSHSPVPTVHSLSPEVPIIGACGGHCPGFEYVCYYILQVLFVVGILTGISLCIAGIVLRRTNRNGDLGVLVYIGCLSSCVCGVLLGVQCCVRRDIKRRKLRAAAHIPMHSIQEAPATAHPLLSASLPHTHSQVYRPGVYNSGRSAVLQLVCVAHADTREREWLVNADHRRGIAVRRTPICSDGYLGMVCTLGRRQREPRQRRRRADGAQPLHRPAGGGAVRARARRAARARRRDAQPHGQQGMLEQRRRKRQDVGWPAVCRVKNDGIDTVSNRRVLIEVHLLSIFIKYMKIFYFP